MSKERKIQKDKVQSVKECKNFKKKKKTRIQSAFLEVMEKIQKNVILYFFVKIRKNTNAISQKYQIQKKIRNKNFKNAKYKKNTNPKFQNTKYTENTKSKMSQRANPMFTLEIRKQIAKKIQNQPVVFSKPCSSDFGILNCIVTFFLIWTEDPSVANADYSTLSSRVIDVAMEAKKINHIHKNWDSVHGKWPIYSWFSH